MAPLFNDLFCFYALVGNWKELTPPDILDIKRKADKIFHVNASLFSDDFSSYYDEFMGSCFKTYTGMGEGAKLRTPARLHKLNNWDERWEHLFADDSESVPKKTIQDTYTRLMGSFAHQLGVGLRGLDERRAELALPDRSA